MGLKGAFTVRILGFLSTLCLFKLAILERNPLLS